MKRRDFLSHYGKLLLLLAGSGVSLRRASAVAPEQAADVTLSLSGDVMTGRGIDQVLPRPSIPVLYERYAQSARAYVELAEAVNGPLPQSADFSYPWGDALEELARVMPDVRIVNLETSITTSGNYWKGKGIHYRMHPENALCLKAAGIDCCVLANNHVLDWGYAGLEETLATLALIDMQYAGAGRGIAEAKAPAVLGARGKGRVLVFGFASPDSGVPRAWAATDSRAGVNYLPDLSQDAIRRVAADVRAVKTRGDIVVLSIHWGSNWGYDVPEEQIRFAHRLIDEAGVDLIHGHSSHHPKGIEVYRGRPILYGCGDLLNDYEGIGGHENYRGDLALIYFVTINPTSGLLQRLKMVPFQIKRFRLNRVSLDDAQWLQHTLNRECEKFGGRLELNGLGHLELVTAGDAEAAGPLRQGAYP